MEPPGPFVQTMEMLDRLQPGEKMLLLLFREPHPLFRSCVQNGHDYETEADRRRHVRDPDQPLGGGPIAHFKPSGYDHAGACCPFENAPPFAAPLRLFLTAPAFRVLRWPPVGLGRGRRHGLALDAGNAGIDAPDHHRLHAADHARCADQILPVVAGSNLPRPLVLARVVNIGLSLGALLLAGGFLDSATAPAGAAPVCLA